MTAPFDIDAIIDRLLEVRGSKPGRAVQLSEAEIRELCYRSREIFISQPILLELEAPIKICGKSTSPFKFTVHRSLLAEKESFYLAALLANKLFRSFPVESIEDGYNQVLHEA